MTHQLWILITFNLQHFIGIINTYILILVFGFGAPNLIILEALLLIGVNIF